MLVLWHWGLRNRAEPFSSIVDNLWPVLVKTMEGLGIDIRREAVSPAALCKGRQDIGIAPFEFLHAIATEKHLRDHRGLALHKGYRLWAVDGSCLNLPSNKNLDAAFGRPSTTGRRKALPQASFVALELVNTGWIADFVLARWDVGELSQSKAIAARLGKGDLLLADRLYFDPAWFAELCQRQVKFLFRLNCNRHKSLTPESQLKVKELRLKGDVDCRVDLRVKTPSGNYEQLKNLRYIEFHRESADTLYLITNLDESEASLQELVALYKIRWEIETNFRFFKGQDHLPSVRSKKEDTVRQEVAVHVLAHNSVRFIQAEACMADNARTCAAPKGIAETMPTPSPTSARQRDVPPVTGKNHSAAWVAKHFSYDGPLRPVDLQFNRTVNAVIGFAIEVLMFPEASSDAWSVLLKKLAALKIFAKPGRAYPRSGRKFNKGTRKKGNVKAQKLRSKHRKNRGQGES